jgi:hypothetical protein
MPVVNFNGQDVLIETEVPSHVPLTLSISLIAGINFKPNQP